MHITYDLAIFPLTLLDFSHRGQFLTFFFVEETTTKSTNSPNRPFHCLFW